MKISTQLKQTERDPISINDKFIIKQTIGKGTFGKVKLGINKETYSKVAIKILEKNRITTEEDYERLERELSIISQFTHPNVIQTYEIINSKNNYYIIMEYCEGGELFNHIVENQRLSENEGAIYYYQLIKGLEYIHSHNVVHRDLKPENLLLGKGNMLKIIDFGLSNYYKGKLLKTPCGSPCYASPEMVSGNRYNGYYIDVWSTGIILFAMLCGYLPFESENNEILFQQILECRLTYPSHISSTARGLLMKILVTDPEKRIKIKEIKKHPFYLQGRALFNLNHRINTQLNGNNKERTTNLIMNKYSTFNTNNTNCNITSRNNENVNSNIMHFNCNTEVEIKPNTRISRNSRKKEMSYNFKNDNITNESNCYCPITTENISKNKTMDNKHHYNSNSNTNTNTNSNTNTNNYYNYNYNDNGLHNHECYITTSVNINSKKDLITNSYHPNKLISFNSKPVSTNQTNNNSRNNITNNRNEEYGANLNHFYFQDKRSNSNIKNKPNPITPHYNLQFNNNSKGTNKENSSVKISYINQPISKKTNQICKDIKIDIGNDITNYVSSKEKTQRCNTSTAKSSQKLNYTTFRNSNNANSQNIGIGLNTALSNNINQENKSLSPKQKQKNTNSSSIPHYSNYNNLQTEAGYNDNNNVNHFCASNSPKMNNYINIENNCNNRKSQASRSVFSPKKPDTLYSDYLNSKRTVSEISSSSYQPIERNKYVPSFNIHKDSIQNTHHVSNTYNSTTASNTNTNNNTRANITLRDHEYIDGLNDKISINRVKDNPVYLTTDIQSNYNTNKKPTSPKTGNNNHNKIFNSRNIQTANDPISMYNKREHLTAVSAIPSSYARHEFNTSLNYLNQQVKNMSRE